MQSIVPAMEKNLMIMVIHMVLLREKLPKNMDQDD